MWFYWLIYLWYNKCILSYDLWIWWSASKSASLNNSNALFSVINMRRFECGCKFPCKLGCEVCLHACIGNCIFMVHREPASVQKRPHLWGQSCISVPIFLVIVVFLSSLLKVRDHGMTRRAVSPTLPVSCYCRELCQSYWSVLSHCRPIVSVAFLCIWHHPDDLQKCMCRGSVL